jgi:hypothetical protein
MPGKKESSPNRSQNILQHTLAKSFVFEQHKKLGKCEFFKKPLSSFGNLRLMTSLADNILIFSVFSF